ncbi:MAG: TlpA family protein disulfide reductase [Burkholderiales bacterium]|nr:TlpA family protein disulfide reductase [Burkholderiales bacterium]
MTRNRQIALIVIVAIVAVAAGIYFNPLSRVETPPTEPQPSPAGAMETNLADLEGGQSSLSKWNGKVLVVNFWATWCAPCRAEMPVFVRMQSELGGKGLQFVGVAIDEQPKVRMFAQEIGVNYPILVGELDAVELARAFGNTLGALPFTVVIDRNGQIVRTFLGELNEAKLLAAVAPFL